MSRRPPPNYDSPSSADDADDDRAPASSSPNSRNSLPNSESDSLPLRSSSPERAPRGQLRARSSKRPSHSRSNPRRPASRRSLHSDSDDEDLDEELDHLTSSSHRNNNRKFKSRNSLPQSDSDFDDDLDDDDVDTHVRKRSSNSSSNPRPLAKKTVPKIRSSSDASRKRKSSTLKKKKPVPKRSQRKSKSLYESDDDDVDEDSDVDEEDDDEDALRHVDEDEDEDVDDDDVDMDDDNDEDDEEITPKQSKSRRKSSKSKSRSKHSSKSKSSRSGGQGKTKKHSSSSKSKTPKETPTSGRRNPARSTRGRHSLFENRDDDTDFLDYEYDEPDTAPRKSSSSSPKDSSDQLMAPSMRPERVMESILGRRLKSPPQSADNTNNNNPTAAETNSEDANAAKAPTSEDKMDTSPDGVTAEKKPSEEESDTPKLPEDPPVYEYLVKWKKLSHIHCEWVEEEVVLSQAQGKSRLKRFSSKQETIDLQRGYNKNMNPEADEDELIPEDFVTVDRILCNRTNTKGMQEYLVKWCSRPYADSTWELAEDVKDDNKISEYRKRNTVPPDHLLVAPPRPDPKEYKCLPMPKFRNGGALRDYQMEGFNWLVSCWFKRQGCILADEMGLGKTIQSVSFLNQLFVGQNIRGPFLVLAPLSTLGHWQREFETWTEMNTIVYHGSTESRRIISEYEWSFGAPKKGPPFKWHAMITTFETILQDANKLRLINWKAMVVDEAHRLKNRASRLVDELVTFKSEHRVLLTGTPIQNNSMEVWALLNFLDPHKFMSETEFANDFADIKTAETVDKLKRVLRPFLLRRLKEDVEKSIPPKEETVVSVELTKVQKKWYRAMLEQNFTFLDKGAKSSNVGNLRNIVMELRKCCNHPYLIKGVEEIECTNLPAGADRAAHMKHLVAASGKMVLVDKLLPSLKEQGHRVLIFSQMIRVLDILEDYLLEKRWGYERIDGRVRGNDRQQAIDRFSKPDSDKFVFLLCTRAGGQGINLTCADTVIIYDSDWNPQNDVQAQARCHRIGQKTMVKIYRLITRGTYEQDMFDRASKKLGLDQAILQNMGKTESVLTGAAANKSANKSKSNKNVSLLNDMNKLDIDSLLKKGAYDVFNEDDAAADAFTSEDIHEILERRTRVLSTTAANAGPSEFSKASFKVESNAGKGPDLALDDPDFWKKLMPEASAAPDPNIENLPRRRRQTVRYQPKLESDESEEEEEEEEEGQPKIGPDGKRYFNKGERHRLQRAVMSMGWGRWHEILEYAGSPVTDRRNVDDVAVFCKALIRCCWEVAEQTLADDPKGQTKMTEIKKRIADVLEEAFAPHRAIIGKVRKKRRSKSGNGKQRSKEGSDEDMEESEEVESDSEVEGTADEYGNILGPVNSALPIFTDPILVTDEYSSYLARNCSSILERMELLGNVRKLMKDGSLNEGSEMPVVGASGSQALEEWWDASFDRDLLRGTFKHGFSNYNAALLDPELCFMGRVLPPEDQKRSNGTANGTTPDYESDASGGKTKKKQLKHDSNGKAESGDGRLSSDSEDDRKTDDEKPVMYVPEEELKSRKWPPVNVLNVRVRKLVRGFERMRKRAERVAKLEEEHEKSRRMKEEKRIAREKQQEEHALEKSRKLAEQNKHWSKKEKHDFCKYFSATGAPPLDNHGQESWALVKTRAGLTKKEPDQIEDYAKEFVEMVEVMLMAETWIKKHKSALSVFFATNGPKPEGEVAGGSDKPKGKSKKKPNVPYTLSQLEDARVTIVNAKKYTERNELITKIRGELLNVVNEEQTRRLLERKGVPLPRERLPDWWTNEDNRLKVDIGLLQGIAIHGFDPTLTALDESLPFHSLLAQNVLDYITNTLSNPKETGSNFDPDHYQIPKDISDVADADILTFFPKDRTIIGRLQRLITIVTKNVDSGSPGATTNRGKGKQSGKSLPRKRSLPVELDPPSNSRKAGRGSRRGLKDGNLLMTIDDGVQVGAVPSAFERVPTDRMTRKLLKFLKQQKKINSNQTLKLSLPDWSPVETDFGRVNADGTDYLADDAKPNKRRRVTGNGMNSHGGKNDSNSSKKDTRESLMHKVQRDEDGQIVFPIRLGVLTIENLGRVDHERRQFHTERTIFPIGFKSVREYTSMIDISRQCKYVCEILDEGGSGPVFQVTCLDGDKPVKKDSSSSACWTYVMTAIREATPDDRKRLHTTVSGPEYFGLSNALVQELVQDLPGAEHCERYNRKTFVCTAKGKRGDKSRRPSSAGKADEDNANNQETTRSKTTRTKRRPERYRDEEEEEIEEAGASEDTPMKDVGNDVEMDGNEDHAAQSEPEAADDGRAADAMSVDGDQEQEAVVN